MPTSQQIRKSIGYTDADSSGRGARDGRAVMGEKGERPERVFPGRTDPWFIAAMVIVAGGLSAACIACFLSSSPALLWGWLALLPIPALVALAALPVRSNRLELYGDRLVVVYAGTRSVIPTPTCGASGAPGRSGRGRPTRSTASTSRRPTTATPSSRSETTTPSWRSWGAGAALGPAPDAPKGREDGRPALALLEEVFPRRHTGLVRGLGRLPLRHWST